MFQCGINIIFHTREKCVIYGAILRVYKSLQSKQIPTLNPLNIERTLVQNPLYVSRILENIFKEYWPNILAFVQSYFQTNVNQQLIIFYVDTHIYLSIWPYLHHLRHPYCCCWMGWIFRPAVIFLSDRLSQKEVRTFGFLAIRVWRLRVEGVTCDIMELVTPVSVMIRPARKYISWKMQQL